MEPANYNCPGQVVIAGHTQAMADVRSKVLSKAASLYRLRLRPFPF